MCYFHTSSTISFKLKCDISRFTHCIHEEMRSGCACICKSCVKTRIICCWRWRWRCAGIAGGWRPGAAGAAWSPTSWPSLITALPSQAAIHLSYLIHDGEISSHNNPFFEISFCKYGRQLALNKHKWQSFWFILHFSTKIIANDRD